MKLDFYIFCLGAKVKSPDFSNKLGDKDLCILTELEELNKGNNIVLSKESTNFINSFNEIKEILF